MPEPSTELNTYVGRYRLIQRIGGGAMGDVYSAEDTLLERTVAVKLAKTGDTGARARFLDEARFAARVVHPNLVSIFDVGVEGEVVYLAMELVHGVPLLSLLRRGPCDWMVAAAVGLGVSAGLGVLHEAGLVHRDIKPGNLMLGVGGTLKIVDFGIAAPEGTIEHDAIVGSPGYIAPEVVLGASPRRTADIFALGVVLHELVTGRRLFAGATSVARILAVTQGTAPRLPSALAPDWFADIVTSCLAPDPSVRFQHARDIQLLLQARAPHGDLSRLALPPTGVSSTGPTGERATDDDVPTTSSVPGGGMDPSLLDWVLGHRGSVVWMHGPHGIGKSRIATELAARCDAGGVLLVQDATGLTALAEALSLESLSDEVALGASLGALAPILIVFEDVPGTAMGLELLRRVRTHVPDAVVVVTSTEAPLPDAPVVSLPVRPLSDAQAERLLLDHVGSAHGTWVRNMVPLAGGSPLGLTLLGRSLSEGRGLLATPRGGDLCRALLEQALLSLSPAMRSVVELLAIGPARASVVLDREDSEDALGSLWKEGLAERRDTGLVIHAAFREVVLERLRRDGRVELLRRAFRERLAQRVEAVVAEAEGPAPKRALRLLVLLRPAVMHEVEQALLEDRLEALEGALLLLSGVIDPSLPRFDGALPVLHRLLAALERAGASAARMARAHVVRAWAHEDDLDASLGDAERALSHAPSDIPALAVFGSVIKRLGRDVEARAVFERILAIAGPEDESGYALLSRWELLVRAVQGGRLAEPRRALAAETFAPIPGRLGPRIMVLRVLVALELGDLLSSARAVARAVEGARELGQSRFAVIGLMYELEIQLRRGDIEAAERAGRQGLVLARAANLPLAVGHLHGLLGLTCLLGARIDEALRLTREGHRRVREVTRNVGQIALYAALEALALSLSGGEGAREQIEVAEGLVVGVGAYAPAIEVYGELVRAATDADALERLDALLAAGLPTTTNAELALAHTVANALRPRLHGPRATWHGHA